ncbi:MAG: hypothetical protein M5U30_21580 [Burkholderiaceae bacterium]|nr:hypothetical protein [Burkholderiaceae bacterium]
MSNTVMSGNTRRFWVGARQAEPRDARRVEPRDLAAVEADAARCRRQRARDAVEQRGLAGAVRADEPEQLARGHAEAHVVDRAQAGEVAAQTADLEQRAAHDALPWLAHALRDARRNSASAPPR